MITAERFRQWILLPGRCLVPAKTPNWGRIIAATIVTGAIYWAVAAWGNIYALVLNPEADMPTDGTWVQRWWQIFHMAPSKAYLGWLENEWYPVSFFAIFLFVTFLRGVRTTQQRAYFKRTACKVPLLLGLGVATILAIGLGLTITGWAWLVWAVQAACVVLLLGIIVPDWSPCKKRSATEAGKPAPDEFPLLVRIREWLFPTTRYLRLRTAPAKKSVKRRQIIALIVGIIAGFCLTSACEVFHPTSAVPAGSGGRSWLNTSIGFLLTTAVGAGLFAWASFIGVVMLGMNIHSLEPHKEYRELRSRLYNQAIPLMLYLGTTFAAVNALIAMTTEGDPFWGPFIGRQVLWMMIASAHLAGPFNNDLLKIRTLVTKSCVKCKSSLVGLTEPRCPECGTPVDPEVLPELTTADMTVEAATK